MAGSSDCKAVAAAVLPTAVVAAALLPHPRALQQGRQLLAAASAATEALLQAALCLDAATRQLRRHRLRQQDSDAQVQAPLAVHMAAVAPPSAPCHAEL